MKERRRANMKSVVRRRFGLPDPVEASSERSEDAVASTSTGTEGEATVVVEVVPEVVATTQKPPRKKRHCKVVPQTDRVTRPRRTRSATDS